MGVAGVLITVILSHLLYSRSGYTHDLCARGWFGPHCQYKCRCVNDQCDVNGNCTSQSACQPGWFGPACQYYNLVGIGQPSYGSRDITDENDSTCNVLGNFMSMSTRWTAVYHFSWLRLRVSKPDVAHQIKVSITNEGKDTTCADLTRVAIDDHTLDIHCPTSVLMNQIELTGSGVNFTCSLYISGGRNVALKEKAWQSSNYKDSRFNPNYSKSDNAVNGDTSGNFEQQSCAHTDYQLRPTWNLSLTTPKLVNRYVVYNRDQYGMRLRGFILESYNKSEAMVLQYREDNKTNISYTVIDTKIGQQVHRVRIYLNGIEYLTICEVELYGDSICPHGSYGRDCEYMCKCDDKSDSCFVSTGGCPSGCPAGFYGEGCRQALPLQEQEHIAKIVGPLVAFIVLVTVIGVLIWRRRRYKKDGPGQASRHIYQNNAEIDRVHTVTLKPQKAATKQTKLSVIKKPNDSQDKAGQQQASIGYRNVASRFSETPINVTDQNSSMAESRNKYCQDEFNGVPTSTGSTGATSLSSGYQHMYSNANVDSDNPYEIPIDSTTLTQKELRLKPEDHMAYTNDIMINLYDSIDDNVPEAYENDM